MMFNSEAVIFVGGLLLIFIGIIFYLYWLRGRLIVRKFSALFPVGSKGEFFALSNFYECGGEFECSTDIGRYMVAIYSEYFVAMNRYQWSFVIKQKLPLDFDVIDGIYGKSYSVDFYESVVGEKSVFSRNKLNLEGIVPELWDFAEVSGGDLTVFYQLPEVIGYGRLNEISKWVLERNESA
jgi:hypothetical protein